MRERVIAFISDLHLKADRPDITQRFDSFLTWAHTHARAVYILGDLFHVWSGDDCADVFSLGIANKLHQLHLNGIAIYFMAGNRDFLLGEAFAVRAGMTIIKEPYRLELGNMACLLTHGDRYCLDDKRHQWFRVLTRNRWFTPFFLSLPIAWRKSLTGGVRKRSQVYQRHFQVNTAVSPTAVITEMQHHQVYTLIHGHTHQPGTITYDAGGEPLPVTVPLSRNNSGERIREKGFLCDVKYTRYVLSDWDDTPQIMCYDKSRGLFFEQVYEGLDYA